MKETACVFAYTLPLSAYVARPAKRQYAYGPHVALHAGTTFGSKERGMKMNTRAMVYRMALLALTVAPTGFVAANEPLSIRVSPAVSFAPANLIIVTRVDPDADNRAIEIVADSEEFYRSSTVQLEGDQAPKTTSFVFRSLPPGEYDVRASVISTNGKPKAVARAHAHVIESGSSR